MTKIFKSALFAATAAVTFAAVPALADSSVLVVDFDTVFQNSAAAKSGTQQLRAKYDAQLTARRNAFQAAAQTYNTQVETAKKTVKPGTPIPPATQTALQQAGEKAQAAEQALQDIQQEVNQTASYVRQQIIEHAGPVAEQIRAERKAAIVMSKDATLASDPANDVTAQVVQRLDAAFPTPSIVVPQQGAAPAGVAPSNAQAPQGR
jgi:Skp family chaperone for outer membrane proteins